MNTPINAKANGLDIAACQVGVWLVPDFCEGQHALAELQARIGILPPELRQRLFDIPNFAAELIRFEVDPGVAGAVEMTVRAYPSDRLLMLLATLRAGNVDFAAIEQVAHGFSPSLSRLQSSVEGGAGMSGKGIPAPFAPCPQFSCGADAPRKGAEE